MSEKNLLESPFAIETDAPLVAIKGPRCGYLQLSTNAIHTRYADLPMRLFQASQAWASRLEQLGAPRVYWITLSEVVTHLHIHLYHRWPEDTEKGVPLFEAREKQPQPAWTDAVEAALVTWAK